MTNNQELSKTQQEIVEHYKGPALVVAGPGAGKTFVITERVKNLIINKKVNPENILVTTFTDKASNELKVRLSKTVGKRAELIQISTIHAFCKSMLEKYFLHHEYGANIDVLDAESQSLFIDLNRVELGVSTWKDGRLVDIKKDFDFVKSLTTLYNTMTENRIDPEKLKEDMKKKGILSDEENVLIQSYSKYLELISKERKIDFAGLQTKFYELMNNRKEVLKDIQETFDFLLIDEYQDTSPLQDKIFRLIAGKNQNIFVVGDENQSIYGFRGASLRNFKKFIERFDKVTPYFLNVNFRSTKNIVDFSNKVFEKEVKKILDSKRRDGEKIKVIDEKDSDATAQKTIEFISDLKKKGLIKNYGDIALLFRSVKGHSPEYIKYLEREKIPFVTFGDGKFMERDDIRIMLYTMTYVLQKLHSDNKFSKWQNWWKKDLFLTDFFGFSESTKKIIKDSPFNMYELRDDEDFKKLNFKDKTDINKIKMLNRLRDDVEREREKYDEMYQGQNSLLHIFYKILDYTGYFKRLMDKFGTEEKEILYNLGRLSKLISRYMEISKKEDIKGFMWYVYNAGDNIDQKKVEDETTVKLMTVHQAKGLEFPVVFVCCLNEGRFPLRFRVDHFVDIPKEFFDREDYADAEEEFFNEEKRLFYVALTRAQDDLIFTTSDKHRVNSWHKSRFLDLIPQDMITAKEFKIPVEKNYSIKKQVPNLNYSAINTFLDCPLRYAMIYEYGFVTPSTFTQSLGTFIHNTLQKIHESLRKGAEIKPAEMKEIVNSYWIDLPTKKSTNEKIKENHFKAFIKYYITAKDYYKQILAIEESFSHIDDNMIIKGKVDLIVKNKNGENCLIDFKARKKKGIEETHVAEQLQIYDYCLNTKYHIDKIIAYTFEDNQRTEFPMNQKKIKVFLDEMSEKIKKEDFFKRDKCNGKDCIFHFYCGEDKK